ncbi:endospore germination permease [Alteribacillus sp. HJP-4]|uniref:GerAB/ArcD/ProY family transporter n=1 Tax=Alteribacillus sp. HJP-4 TaxID=2775394 RepID=UPI0035CD3561
MEKGKISAFQMGLMMYPTIVATGILFVQSAIVSIAGRDLWISPIWAAVVGFLAIIAAILLHKWYPGLTIIEYSERILGTFIGKIISFFTMFLYITSTGIMTWQYGEYVVSDFLNRTPLVVIIGSMLMACAFAIFGGIEVLGRLSNIIVPIFILLLFLIVLLLIPEMEFKRMLPLWEEGVQPSIDGAWRLQTWFAEYGLICFLLPYIADQKKVWRWGMLSLSAVTVTMVFTSLAVLLVFGDVTESINAPLMTAARYISIAEFISHLESIVMAVWILGTFLKIGVFYYVCVLGTAQWLNLKDFRPIILPMGLIIGIFAVTSFSNSTEASEHFEEAFIDTTVYGLVIPVILLLLAWIRKILKR